MSVQMQAQPSAQTTTQQGDATFLRRVLMGNALFSAVSGSEFLFFRGQVADWLGMPNATTYIMALGGGVLLFALFVWWVARQDRLDRRMVQAILWADIVWVVGSIMLLLSGWLPFSTTGYWIVAVLADLVAIFAILEFIGLRRHY